MKKLLFGLYYLKDTNLIGDSWRDNDGNITVIRLPNNLFYTKFYGKLYIKFQL